MKRNKASCYPPHSQHANEEYIQFDMNVIIAHLFVVNEMCELDKRYIICL